ncbi:MAG TPA: non-canonical purine NTP pyrophosphatase [Longimicrobiales bacterium]
MNDQPTLLVATRSAHKLEEIRAILGDCGARVLSLDDAGVAPDPAEDAIEAYDTFAANALAKATWFCARTGLATVADDSGIVVPALGGQPGVLSRRYAETLGVAPVESERDATNTRLLLEQAARLDGADRRAWYACVAALALPGGETGRVRATRIFVGTCEGELGRVPVGAGGFGYDPIFRVPELDATFAQVDADVKHRLSHRARAFRALASALPAALR